MTTEIRVWKIQKDNHLKPVKSSRLNLETRLEDWLEEDISIVDEDLLVIGRQVSTEYSGAIDLFCLNGQGDVVIVELKRDKTPREITAQVLDYASWVKDLSRDRIIGIADEYLRRKRGVPLEEAFREKFSTELPDVLNEAHSMMIVATQIDPASERIIKYLSDNYGVGINAATFQYFKGDADDEYLARAFLIKPSQVERKKQERSSSKRRPNLSLEELMTIADENGVGDFYKSLSATLEKYLKKSTTISSLGFYGMFGDSRKTIFSLIPTESTPEEGLKFQIYLSRFINYFNTEQEDVLTFLPEHRGEWHYAGISDPEWSGFAGFFRTEEEVKRFIAGMKKLKS